MTNQTTVRGLHNRVSTLESQLEDSICNTDMMNHTIRELRIRVSTLETQHEHPTGAIGDDKKLTDGEMFLHLLKVSVIYRPGFTSSCAYCLSGRNITLQSSYFDDPEPYRYFFGLCAQPFGGSLSRRCRGWMSWPELPATNTSDRYRLESRDLPVSIIPDLYYNHSSNI